MALADMLRRNREESEVSIEELADKLGVPGYLVTYLEDPDAPNPELEKILAEALGISVEMFRGEERRPSKEEVQDRKATYPAIRAFLFDPARCVNPPEARTLLSDSGLPAVEQNLLVYMATMALYHFCDENYSSFSFDTYVFSKHASLLKRLTRSLADGSLSDEEKEERLAAGRANVFSCDSIENIAVMILEDFAAELEVKLAQDQHDFEEEVGMPWQWYADLEVKRIEVRAPDGRVRETLKLIDASKRTQHSAD